MKTTFKKTMAAVAAAAVVAASASVMAMPASAAGSISISSVEMTLSDLQAANYQVTLNVNASEDVDSMAFGFYLDEGLTLDGAAATAATAMCAYAQNADFVWYPIIAMSTVSGSPVGTITVTVDSSAKAGDVYTLEATTKNAAGAEAVDLNGDTASVSSGSITILPDPTEPPTATPVTETEAPTEAPSVATTPTKTDSPKTGDALPIAGVAVAVAVIGGVALVSKKRK